MDNLSTEEYLLNWLKQHDCPEARLIAAHLKSFGTITVRYCEFTGGYIDQTSMNAVLSDECFGSAIPESEALYRKRNDIT
jgi:hypothetical protein